MNGLECSEIMYSDYLENRRFDSEFYLKNDLLMLNLMRKKFNVAYLENYADITDGIHESIIYSKTSGINLISAKAPKNNIFNLSSSGFISKEQHVSNYRTSLRDKDIILSTVGTIGNCAVVDENILPANSDRHVGIIRLKKEEFKPYYISTFILSAFGQIQTKRHTTGNVQPNLFIEKLKILEIPLMSKCIQDVINDSVIKALKIYYHSKEIYSEAEQILLKALNMDNFVPSQKNTTTKSLSQFMNAGRLDAEYFQPKYDDIENKIELLLNDKKNGCFTVNNIISESNRVIKIEDKKEYKYIELSDIDNYGNVTDCTIDIGINLPSRARKEVHTGDVIVSSLEGSLQKCAIITETFNGALVSTGFHVVKSDEINSETLLLLFKSWFMQELMRKHSTGAIMAATSDDSFKKILLPVVKLDVQEMIANKIQKSFELRAKSNELLEAAKRAVEIAIEEDEETAMQYLEQFECVGKEV